MKAALQQSSSTLYFWGVVTTAIPPGYRMRRRVYALSGYWTCSGTSRTSTISSSNSSWMRDSECTSVIKERRTTARPVLDAAWDKPPAIGPDELAEVIRKEGACKFLSLDRIRCSHALRLDTVGFDFPHYPTQPTLMKISPGVIARAVDCLLYLKKSLVGGVHFAISASFAAANHHILRKAHFGQMVMNLLEHSGREWPRDCTTTRGN